MQHAFPEQLGLVIDARRVLAIVRLVRLPRIDWKRLADAAMDEPTAKARQARVRAYQARVRELVAETGLPRTHLSRILSMSIGTNRTAAELRAYMGE